MERTAPEDIMQDGTVCRNRSYEKNVNALERWLKGLRYQILSLVA
jgi:hypothetical protein